MLYPEYPESKYKGEDGLSYNCQNGYPISIKSINLMKTDIENDLKREDSEICNGLSNIIFQENSRTKS